MLVSIRARLTLYFTVLFGVIVVGLAVASYLLFAHDTYSKLDSALRIAVSTTASLGEHEMNESPTKAAAEAELQSVLLEKHNTPLPDTQILVREGDRQAAYKPDELPTTPDLPKIPAAQLNRASDLQGLRIAHRRLDIPKFNARYQISAAKPLAPVQAEISDFRIALLILVPLGLGLAALAGYLLARRSLSPLRELTETIAATTSSDLTAGVNLTTSQDEIGRLARQFNRLLERLEIAFTSQRRFMADASHELRTPVSVALSAAQVTVRDPHRSVSDCDEALEVIEHQMLRLRRIVDDMLFLSQADVASPGKDNSELFLDEAVSEASRSASALARAKQQNLILDELPEARCLGDQDLLTRAILILLDNAIKFTPPGGEIRVGLQRRATYWVCSVTDSGVGIPEAAQPHIFERFFRGDSPTGQTNTGAGLGLAIARSIVESHAGNIRLVSSRPGATSFEIAIPALDLPMKPPGIQAKSFAVRM
ncbi:MAG TPA: ATP-binding protein [Bryobacteraceae bacterium]|nr:ATP-binding protein [Bryobacteraceae bacterium]